MQYVKEHKDKANWIEFKQILEDNFKPVDYKDRLKIQLRDLKQGDSYDNYARKFRAIVNLLDDMSEEDKIFWFTEGLNNKTKYEVKSKECETLEEAFKVAARYDSCFGKVQVGINYTNKLRNNFSKFNNGLRRSFSGTSRTNGQTPRSKYTVTCYRCKKAAHRANECRVLLNNVPNAYNKGNEGVNFKPKYKTVAICRSNMDSILSINGYINDVIVKLSLDSGAVESIM